MSEEPGSERVIAGRYRLLSPLGEGGMGTVWRARDEVLHREVAVKEVRAPAGLSAADVERMYTRLEREAWAAARITDRNVVTVYDVATEDGRPWIVMELVRGLSLADVLEAEGPLDPRRAAHVGAEVLAALRAAHGAGVLHRDVKPANVLIANDGRIVLTDFGIAVVEGSSALTMTGEVVGSPEFLAPERALGRAPAQSDLWSLGVLLYASVEGCSPFRQATPLSTLRAIVDEELPPPRRAGPLAPVVEGLLREDPAERLPAERAQQDLRLVAAGVPLPREARPAPARRGRRRTPHRRHAPTARGHRRSPAPAPTPAPAAGTAETARPARPPYRRRPGRGRGRTGPGAGRADVRAAEPRGRRGRRGRFRHRPGEAARVRPRGPAARTGTRAAGDGRTDRRAGPTVSASGDDGYDDGEETTPPPQSVRVTVEGAHTEYSGVCPPPRERAPAFTATFTVGRLRRCPTAGCPRTVRWPTGGGGRCRSRGTAGTPGGTR
ncbi:serine/threonine-protein kinase [Streptomyces sp. INA 01156]